MGYIVCGVLYICLVHHSIVSDELHHAARDNAEQFPLPDLHQCVATVYSNWHSNSHLLHGSKQSNRIESHSGSSQQGSGFWFAAQLCA